MSRVGRLEVPEVTIGSVLRNARQCDEISQVYFAAKFGISKQELNNIENARSSVSIKRAIAFAHKLGYSPELYAKLALEDEARPHGLEIEVSIKSTLAKTAAKKARPARAASQKEEEVDRVRHRRSLSARVRKGKEAAAPSRARVMEHVGTPGRAQFQRVKVPNGLR